MSQLLTHTFITAFIVAWLAGAMPLMLAAVGETIGEQSGVLNLGIEGTMLVGGYFSYVAALHTHSLWLSMLAGGIMGALLTSVLVILSVWFGLNQIVIGIAVTLLGGGTTAVLFYSNYSQSTPRVPPATWNIPGLSDIPILGKSVFNQHGIFWVSILLMVVVSWLLTRTNWGLSVKAAGQKPLSLDAAGGSVMRTRSEAELLAGFFGGLGGAYLALIATSAFTPFMTAGLGYIAIIVTMLSRGKIYLVAIVALIYGLSVASGTVLQLTALNVPTDLISMLPYLVVMAMLLVFARSVYIPPALAAPYTRGAR